MPAKSELHQPPLRLSKELTAIIREIARLEDSTVAKVANRLCMKAAEDELKRIRKQVMERWSTPGK